MRFRQLFTDRAVNGLLLLTIVVLAFTGIVSLFANDAYTALIFEAHRIGGAALLLLLLPKAGIIVRSLRRRWRQRAATERMGVILSLILLVLMLGTIGAALGWSLARGPWAGEWGLPLIVVHWYLGLGLIPLLIGHVALRWRNPNRVPRRHDFAGRRRSIGFAVAAIIALITWRGISVGASATQARTSQRRFTGSREYDDGTPNGFFVTAFISDDPTPLDLVTWRLNIVGRVSQPRELDHTALRREATTVATIDCTGGIYATREWSGLAVGPLLDAADLDPAATTVWFISTTGHRWPLPLAEARRAILATHVNDQPLSHAHGFPLRLIAPERRGFQWIKWLTTIEIA